MAEDTPAAAPSGDVVDTMLEQAHDIGAAIAKLDAIGAAHETIKASIEDVKSTIGFLTDRVTEFGNTVSDVVSRLEKLEPAKAADAAVEGAAGEGAAAIDTVTPETPVQHEGEKSKSVVGTIHDIFG